MIGGHDIETIATRCPASFVVDANPTSGTYVLLLLPGFAGGFLAACWMLVLVLFGATGASPFIYFQF